MTTQRKAIALISGGLDSMLAARCIMEQGVHVEALTFFTGFCIEGLSHVSGVHKGKKPKRNNAAWVAEQLGIPHHIENIVEEYKAIVLNPKHGYGANLNPCLDCKVFMLKKAHQWIEENGFDFIVTGEVVGQRPMSQRRDTMPVVARESGAGALLLRPLSAKNLPLTLPEREGWVDREQLFDFSGRSRKPQIALAARYGIEEYSQPAGGCCVLTDKSYTLKMQDLWAHRGRRDYEFDDIMLLNVGRHLRPRDHFKVIVSRDEGENRFLEGYRKAFTSLKTISHAGPLALIDGEGLTEEELLLAARITARFSQGRDAERVQIRISAAEGEPRIVDVRPLSPDDIQPDWYV